MASIPMKLVHAAFSASERIMPSTAGKVAFELFCRTPNPSRLTHGEKRAVEGAVAFMAGARHHKLMTGRRTIAVHDFRPAGDVEAMGRVLVVHGWRSRTEYMRTLIEALVGAGYHVYSLDLPGHGGSSGRKLDMKLAVEAVRAAADWFGPFYAIVGHSFGGAVAVNAVVGTVKGVAPVPTARIVTIASPSVVGDIFAGFADFVGLGERTRRAMNGQVERIAGRPLDEYKSGSLLARMPVETLVIHAHDDREVAPYHAELVAKAGDHVRLEWRDGLGHRRIIADADVARSVVSFVSAPLADRLAA